jgi:16S rRNA processing protein RimM
MLSEGKTILVAGRETRIERRAGADAAPIIRLEGIGSRNEAEALRGTQLSVDRRDAPALGDGEYWARELEGCEVTDDGRVIGTVERLLVLPSCEALEVRSAGGEQVLVPMVKDAIRSIDATARRIDIDSGFLGLE